MTLKPFERVYLWCEPALPPLHRIVRRRLKQISRSGAVRNLLDVGGRKSHYTIGVSAMVTVSDLPRDTPGQEEHSLGINRDMIKQLYRKRSNVANVIYDDMSHSAFAGNSFDCVVAVEVLEHVKADDAFIEEVRRTLKPGGVFFMTTPNGEFVKNTNPYHMRHYTRAELRDLLSRYFSNIEIEYAVKGGLLYSLGLRSWSIRHPLRTLLTMFAAFANYLQSTRRTLKDQSQGTQELLATAKK